jgi:molybdopterin converting factor small subunit
MIVRVKLFASLRRFAANGKPGVPHIPGAGFEVDLRDGATLRELIAVLEIPAEEARVAFVNGITHDLNWELKPEDEVGLFPPVGGG